MAKRKLSKQQQRRIASKQKSKIKDNLLQDDKLQLDESSTQTARVISHHGRQLFAETENFERIKCKIRQNLGDIACGDYVVIQQAHDATGEAQNVVVAVKERTNLLKKTGFAGAIKPVAANIGQLFIDKTGTLTANELNLIEYKTLDGDMEDRQSLAIASAIAETSTHPVSKAIYEAGNEFRMPVADVRNVENFPGLGVSGTIDGVRYQLGRMHRGDCLDFDHSTDEQPTIVVYLCSDDKTLAQFNLGEQLRPDAKDAIEQLGEMKISVEILTGDRPGPANRIAGKLNTPVSYEMLPTDKQLRVKDWRTSYGGRRRTVAMAGDGINDAPVLAAADVGFAVGSATELARQAGNIHLTADRLSHIPQTILIARHAMRRIRMNLVWAFSYNAVGLGLAAGGMLNPIFAAIAMLSSSLLIVMTSKNAGNVLYEVGGVEQWEDDFEASVFEPEVVIENDEEMVKVK